MTMNAMFGCLVCLAAPLAGEAQCCVEPPKAEETISLGVISAQRQDDAIAALAFIYPLDTCPVTGKELGSMGDPVVKMYEVEGRGEREVRFCCAGCPPKFEKDQAKYWKEIDEKIIEQQKEHYPLETCIVSGDALGGDPGMGEPVDYIYRNRLVRFCCEGCISDFEAEPEKHLATLDEAIRKAEREKYPLKTCVVSGEELGSMGAPIEVIAGNRLLLFCCKGCISEFKKEPAKAITAINEAWDEAGEAGESQPAGTGAGGHDHSGGGHGGGDSA